MIIGGQDKNMNKEQIEKSLEISNLKIKKADLLEEKLKLSTKTKDLEEELNRQEKELDDTINQLEQIDNDLEELEQ